MREGTIRALIMSALVVYLMFSMAASNTLSWLIGIFVVQFLLIITYVFFRHGSKPISPFYTFTKQP